MIISIPLPRNARAYFKKGGVRCWHGHNGWVCTREPHHEGMHIAHFEDTQPIEAWIEDEDLDMDEGL